MRRSTIAIPLLILALAWAAGPLSAERLQGPEPAPLPIDCETAAVPEGLCGAVQAAAGGRYRKTPVISHLTVGVLRTDGVWALGSLGAAPIGYAPDWGASLWFLGREDPGGGWLVALEGEGAYADLLAAAPAALWPCESRTPYLAPEPRVAALGPYEVRFPWMAGDAWWYTSRWHQGNALDFAVPSDRAPWVLAGTDGSVAAVCDDGEQVSLRLTSPLVGNTSYVHLRSGSVPVGILGATVRQGQHLGELYDGTTGAGWYSLGAWPWAPCNPATSAPCDWNTRTGCCWLQWSTPCGAGTGPHLHWVLPSQSMTIDGWTISPDGCFRRDGQTLCSGPVTSTNQRITDYMAVPPVPEPVAPIGGVWLTLRRLTLEWADGADLDGELAAPVAYQVEVWSASWSSRVISTAARHLVLVVPEDGEYAWRVRAQADELYSEWTPEALLKVASRAPSAPTVVAEGSGCAEVPNNGWQNRCSAPRFTWTSEDLSGAGIAEYAYCWSDAPDCVPSTRVLAPVLAVDSIVPPERAGSRYLNVVAIDSLGQASSRATYALRYDGAPPVTAVQINQGAAQTCFADITLAIEADDEGSGVEAVRVSSDGQTWSSWILYEPLIGWALADESAGEHVVYVQVRDRAGNHSEVAQDSIIRVHCPVLPETGPSGAHPMPVPDEPVGEAGSGTRFGVVLADNASLSTVTSVGVVAQAPGLTHVRLSHRPEYGDEGWRPLGDVLTWDLDPLAPEGYHLPRRVYAWFRDETRLFGPYYAEIVYDPIPPWGGVSVRVRDGDLLTLDIWADDDNSGAWWMRASLDPCFSGVDWVPLASSLALRGEPLYVQFRDRAGNVSRVIRSDGLQGPLPAPWRAQHLPLVLFGVR